MKELKEEPILKEADETFSNPHASYKYVEIVEERALLVMYSMKTVQ